jgi:hypothetical protein
VRFGASIKMAEESPFGKASVMSGYPLDAEEKEAVASTLKASQAANGGSYAIHSPGNVMGRRRKAGRIGRMGWRHKPTAT